MAHPDLHQRLAELIRDHSVGEVLEGLCAHFHAQACDPAIDPIYRESWSVAAGHLATANAQVADLE